MTGSEKILARIEEDARRAAEKTLAEGWAKADALRQEAEEDARLQQQALLDAARAQAEAMVRAAESAAAMERRNALLRCRRDLITQALAQTEQYLLGLPDAAYFDALLPLARQALQPGKGQLILNARDKARLPADFIRQLTRGRTDAVVEAAEETRDISGGFILRYGDVEMNGSLAALIEARRDPLEDLINKELFS